MKILLGVDDSPCSTAAVEYVRAQPWPKGTRVTVVSVARPPWAAWSEVAVPAAGTIQRVWDEILGWHRELATRAARTLRDAGLDAEPLALEGDPREGLVETARGRGADLVVVGSHGRTGIARALLGSVAAHVVTHAPCNVLVVKCPEPK